MNKLAFMLAYSQPEKALDLYVEHFVDSGTGLEKQASLEKRSKDFMESIKDWLGEMWSNPKKRRILLGLGGAAIGGGLGGALGGRKGALYGLGIGGLGGYYMLPGLFDQDSLTNKVVRDWRKAPDTILKETLKKGSKFALDTVPEGFQSFKKHNPWWSRILTLTPGANLVYGPPALYSEYKTGMEALGQAGTANMQSNRLSEQMGGVGDTRARAAITPEQVQNALARLRAGIDPYAGTSYAAPGSSRYFR